MDTSGEPVGVKVLHRLRVRNGVGVSVGVGVTVSVGIIVGVQIGTGVLVAVGRSIGVGVGVTVGETVGEAWIVGVALRVDVLVGVEVGTTAIARGVSVAVEVGVPIDMESWIGVLVGGVVHQGAVKEKPSNTQVRLPPPLQVVWKTPRWRPGWKIEPCPRSWGGGVNRFAAPIEMETA
jgi:hypothetical protein